MPFPLVPILVNVAITAITIGATMILRSRGKDRRTEGFGIDLRANSADPSQPIPIVYGRPRWIPPVLARFLRPPSLNSLTPSKGEVYVVVLSCGAGPNDGRDLSLEMNDEPLYGEVTSSSPAGDRRLSAVDTARKRWVFPKSNIVPESVVVYRDLASPLSFANGGGVADTVETTVSGQVSQARYFGTYAGGTAKSSGTDPLIPSGSLRYGFLLPKTWKVSTGSITVSIIRKNTGQITYFDGTQTTAKEPTVPPTAIRTGLTSDGTPYVWVDLKDGGARIDKFRWSLKYRELALLSVDSSGSMFIDFPNAVGASVDVTAIYRTSKFGNAIRYTFRDGSADQEELPADDGVRNTYTVGLAMSQGSLRRYATKNAVHDVIVGLESGSAGFYDQAVDGQNAGEFRTARRKIQIRVREAGASDILGKNADPSTGWITILDATIEGNVSGTAKWYFSVADLLAKVKNGASQTTGNLLPYLKYEVECVGLDVANADNRGNVLDRIQSTVFFANATEVIRTRLTLPYHSTLTVEVDDLKLIPQEPVFSVQFAGRKVWIPAANSAYSSTTGRPESGSFAWTRIPEWCACDLITDPRFGAGQFYDWQDIDLTAALAAATFHAATETNPDRTTETRAEIDLVLQNRSAILDHVAQMHTGARTMPTLDGGTWKTVIDQDSSSVLAMTDEDIAAGQITATYANVADIATELEAATTLEENGFALTPYVILKDGTAPTQRVTRRLDLSGVRRRTQVDRAMKFALAQIDAQRIVVDLVAAGWKAMSLSPGDVVTLTTTTLGYSAKKFRVIAKSFGSNFAVSLRLAEHVSTVYGTAALAPSSSVTPGIRPPSDTPSTVSSASSTSTVTLLTAKLSAVKVTS